MASKCTNDLTATISKFNGKNYPQWRFQLKHVLQAKGLLGYVNGELQKPGDDDKEGVRKFLEKDALAMCVISSALDYGQVRIIENCEYAKQALDRLDSIYKQKSEFSKMTLLDKFHQLKMGKDESILDYIMSVENLGKEIRETRESLSDVAIITKIIGTLPSKYQNFRQA